MTAREYQSRAGCFYWWFTPRYPPTFVDFAIDWSVSLVLVTLVFLLLVHIDLIFISRVARAIKSSSALYAYTPSHVGVWAPTLKGYLFGSGRTWDIGMISSPLQICSSFLFFSASLISSISALVFLTVASLVAFLRIPFRKNRLIGGYFYPFLKFVSSGMYSSTCY